MFLCGLHIPPHGVSIMSMNKEQLRAWVTSVLSEGITPLQWARASGFKNDNQLRNFLSRPKAGMNAETVAKLKVGLEKLQGISQPPLPPTPTENPPLEAALNAEKQILLICEKLPKEVRAKISLPSLISRICDLLDAPQYAPEPTASKKLAS